jgi:CCR4-NOT transcription complex subunit 1
MEVFSKYIGRLVIRNASPIFSGTKVNDAGSYNLLQDEMQKVLREPGQASKIAEGIDLSEGDLFRDFNLTIFIEHFYNDPIAKYVLALAFRASTRSDLRSKGKSRSHHPSSLLINRSSRDLSFRKLSSASSQSC